MVREQNGLLIRDAMPEDAEQLCRWWNDGRIMEHAGFPNGLGVTADTLRKRLQDQAAGRGNGNHLLIIEWQERPIGEMNVRPFSTEVCEIGIKICDAGMQNRGVGKRVLSLLIHSLFREYGYRQIVLDTSLENGRAQHVYEQLGFRKVRVNRDSWTDQLGRLRSSVDYELTEDRFCPFE